MEIANGVTLNSYIVKGDKTAIIDGVIGWDGVPETLYKNLEEIHLSPKDIDYLIVNHMEPDHSGWIENFEKINDDFTILCTEKAAKLVTSFYGDNNRIKIVKEEMLDLGNGKKLSFHPVLMYIGQIQCLLMNQVQKPYFPVTCMEHLAKWVNIILMMK